MTPLPVSVCIVSWHRPDALKRCMTALGQMDHPNFEVVVVADAEGLAKLPEDVPIKRIESTQANISVARNLGIAASAGEVVAFIDDDAVPEPSWLRLLTAPFADGNVALAGGYVRGRNGISWQSRGRCVNALGETRDQAPVAALPEGFALKTEGTNMAVRRSALRSLGGFDPAFHFFLDETDLNLRLHAAGYRGVMVPEAEVHHGFAASARRRGDRVPTDLHQIGASWAVFLRKHAGAGQIAARLLAIRDEEERRLIGNLISGRLEPRDVRHLRWTFEAGWREGQARSFGVPANIPESPAFLRFPSRERPHSHLTCTPSGFKATAAVARKLVIAGENVTVFNLSRTALYHKVSFTPDGFWLHKGGLYGKSERDQSLFTFWSRAARIRTELKRVQIARNIA